MELGLSGAQRRHAHRPVAHLDDIDIYALFFEEGNRVKTFNATDGVRVEIEATITDAHPLRVTTSKSARADFLEDSQDIDRVSQEGSFKYNEGDRNAVAESAVYSHLVPLNTSQVRALFKCDRFQLFTIDRHCIPAQFAANIKSETDKWAPVIKKVGLKID